MRSPEKTKLYQYVLNVLNSERLQKHQIRHKNLLNKVTVLTANNNATETI